MQRAGTVWPGETIIKLESVMALMGQTRTKRPRREREKSRCKLNFKMTMWRDDSTFHRQ